MIANNPPEIPRSLKGNIALLTVTTYADWLNQVGKKTRNMIRKAEKQGIVVTRTVQPFSIYKIYNETPIRQDRAFKYYGKTLDQVQVQIQNPKSLFIGAYLQNELLGFAELQVTKNTLLISQLLSLTTYSAVNNKLIAFIVELSISMKLSYIVYARFGSHPSLDQFKFHNGFRKYHVDGFTNIRDVLPERIKIWFIPVYNWGSRLKLRLIK